MTTSLPEPTSGFDHFTLSKPLLRAVRAMGYTHPREIQEQTIPAVLEGRDVLGLAQTGTGKTAAFALPILERLLARRGRGPRVLVIAPTRELVAQIDGEFRALGRGTRIRTVTIYGGVSDRAQIRTLERGPEVIVACPGRLLDLIGQRAVRLDGIDTLVLDEADHMFDMGFLPDIRRILKQLPAERQNLLFAATMPVEIRKLAEQILHRPCVAELAHSAPADTIDHALYPVVETRKLELLDHFLARDDFVSAIVFTRTKHRARRLAKKLDASGHRAIALQGDMSQNQRDRAMAGFRGGKFDVLVATDIVARGIDVAQVSHVINYDVPNTPEAYTHRIGRTGRSERSGKAYTFITADDRDLVRAIERTIGSSIEICRVEGFEDAFTWRTGSAAGGNGKNRSGSRGRSKSPGEPRYRSGGKGSGKGSGHGGPRGRGRGAGSMSGEDGQRRRRRRPRRASR